MEKPDALCQKIEIKVRSEIAGKNRSCGGVCVVLNRVKTVLREKVERIMKEDEDDDSQ